MSTLKYLFLFQTNCDLFDENVKTNIFRFLNIDKTVYTYSSLLLNDCLRLCYTVLSLNTNPMSTVKSTGMTDERLYTFVAFLGSPC